jgi:hypothetical protein
MSEEDRPWEQPGRVRRDCLPHRGPLLLFLGTASLCLGVASSCIPPVAVFAIPLGLVISWLARRDLNKMAAGDMDPSGLDEVELAEQRADAGMLLGWFFGACWCCAWWDLRHYL